MFIRLETEVKLSGGNWQQLWGFESNETKCSKSGLTPQLSTKLSGPQCVCVCVCFDSATTHKADICIMTVAAPALSTA